MILTNMADSSIERPKQQTATDIIQQVENNVGLSTTRNNAILAELQVLMLLRYYATGSDQRVAADLAGVSSASVCRIVKSVSEAVALLGPRYITFPIEGDKVRSIK